jgi:uncharacterized protein YlxP (DUF503 family)
MVIGTGTIEIDLPAVSSLKEKRSTLKSLITRVHREFNVACAEVDLHDVWQSTTLGVAVVSTSVAHAQNVIERVVAWIELNRRDVAVIGYTVEIIH